MNELVLALLATPFQFCYESPTDSFGNPYIAIDDPDEISNGLAIRTAHVSNLRVGAELDRAVLQGNILVFDEDFCVEGWKVMEEAFQDWERRVMAIRDTESDMESFLWVGLAEGRGKAVVE